ncbi:MAG: hypothetical protein AAF518_08065 [Spirochaetota bacterium]
MKHFTYTILFAVLVLANCARTTAEKDFDANSALLSVLLESSGTQTDAQRTCQATVVKANECIAPGFGFDAYNSCHSSTITGTAAEWDTLLTDISTAIHTNSCNIPHKKYQDTSGATGGAYNGLTNIEYLKGRGTAAL